jgi:DNA invertase Pin-like site-specific DNA recombinase
MLEELTTLGVAFVSLNEGIDATTPAGRLQMGVLGAIAQFERERIAERVRAGLARARAQGTRLGRRRQRISRRDLERVVGMSVREAARVLGVPPSRVHNERQQLFGKPTVHASELEAENTTLSARA